MPVIESWITQDLDQPVGVTPLGGNLFSGDNAGNLVGVHLTEGGAPASGVTGTVTGYFIRSDGTTVLISGVRSGADVSCTLPLACYGVVGPFSLVIKVGNTTVGAVTGYVYQTSTDTVVDPESVIPSVATLLAKIAEIEDLTETATAAAASASSSKTAAGNSATAAAGSASAASQAASTATTKASEASASAAAAAQAAQDSDNQCFVIDTGVITSFPKVIEDARITAAHVVLDEEPDATRDLGCITDAGRLILYGSLAEGETYPSQKLKLHHCAGMTQDAVGLTLRLVVSSSVNGNYLCADASKLMPGTQYNWSLYRRENGTDTYVYGIGTVVHYPDHGMWFQEVPRGLVDGATYVCTIRTPSGSGVLATSNEVVFAGGANVPASNGLLSSAAPAAADPSEPDATGNSEDE